MIGAVIACARPMGSRKFDVAMAAIADAGPGAVYALPVEPGLMQRQLPGPVRAHTVHRFYRAARRTRLVHSLCGRAENPQATQIEYSALPCRVREIALSLCAQRWLYTGAFMQAARCGTSRMCCRFANHS